MSVRPSLLASVLGWRRPAPAPREPGPLVGLASGAARRERLARLAGRAGLRYVDARSAQEAALLASGGDAIVALESDGGDVPWRESVARLSRDACLVLLAPRDEAPLWEELASRGGFEILPDSASDEEGARLLRRALAWCRARRVTR